LLRRRQARIIFCGGRFHACGNFNRR
jgi:hypothetical protein